VPAGEPAIDIDGDAISVPDAAAGTTDPGVVPQAVITPPVASTTPRQPTPSTTRNLVNT
jgi:hypothetical protein